MSLMKDFIDRTRKKGFVKIILDIKMSNYFLHNIDLWGKWFAQIGVKVNIVYILSSIKKDDICLMLVNSFDGICPCDCYVALQTENLTNIDSNPNSYKNIKVDNIVRCMKYAFMIWDYSLSNISVIQRNYGFLNVVNVPIMFSDNSRMFSHLKYEGIKQYDVILAVNTERRRVMNVLLKKLGLKCINVWRNALPAIVPRCKIFLNLHAYDGNCALEVHRLFDLRNIPIAIVSETCEDKTYPEFKKIFKKYEEIAEFCYKLCNNETLRMKYISETMNVWKNYDNNKITNILTTH